MATLIAILLFVLLILAVLGIIELNERNLIQVRQFEIERGQYQEAIFELTLQKAELCSINAHSFPYLRYQEIKSAIESYKKTFTNPRHLDDLTEAKRYTERLTQKEKEIFEEELEELNRLFYQAENVICKFCSGYGEISSGVEYQGRELENIDECKYCNGSGRNY